jgi:hypothetical protein
MKKRYSPALLFCTIVLLLIVWLSGCTSNQTTTEQENLLSGTWVGELETSLLGRNDNTLISMLTFSQDTVEMTLNSNQSTYTMNFTYVTQGATLTLEPKFNERSGFPGQQPFNGSRPGNWTRPPGNETDLINGTFPFNGTRPGNWSRPENESWDPLERHPSMTVSFSYSINEGDTILYLNGAEFRKI